MAPHSSTLAWKIPWTEEPGMVQSMGPQRVRHKEMARVNVDILGTSELKRTSVQFSCSVVFDSL